MAQADAHLLEDMRCFVSRQQGARRALLAAGAGLAGVLAFAPFHVFPVLFLTLPVFVWLIDSSHGPRRAALDGWYYGFGYFLANLFWIGEAFLVEAEKFALLLPFAVTLLPAGIALFWALAAGLAKRFWLSGWPRLLVFTLILGLAEWLRGHLFTGLPWNVLGYALTYPLALMQSAALFGVYALTFAAVLIFAAPLVLCAEAPDVRLRHCSAMALATALLPVLALYAFGSWRLSGPSPGDIAGVKVRIVQPSVPQREKWLPEKQREIFDDHLALSRTSPSGSDDGLAGITHVVWPEAAMPFLPLEHEGALKEIGDMLPEGTVLVSGALRRTLDSGGRLRGYNSLMAFDTTGRLVATYDKVHLVPFGEYLPFEPLLAAVGFQKLTKGLGAFTSGPSPRPLLSIPGLPATGGLICYEVLFPGEVIDDANRPGLVLNVTNDGWFGDTTGPRQHYYQTRVRAVEEGLPIIRVANNGISAVIDPFGRERARLGLNARGVADAKIPAAAPVTPYARCRGRIVLAIAALLLLSIWTAGRGPGQKGAIQAPN